MVDAHDTSTDRGFDGPHATRHGKAGSSTFGEDGGPDAKDSNADGAGREKANGADRNGYTNGHDASGGWDDLLPLGEGVAPETEFPLHALPDAMAEGVRAIQYVTQAPISMCGQSVLAVATMAAQGHVNVQLPGGQERPVSNFFVTIGRSGERKSTVDGLALAAVREREANWRIDYHTEQQRYEDDLALYEAERKQILSTKSTNGICNKADVRADLEALTKPVEPPPPTMHGSDVTIEGLQKVLEAGRLSFGVFADEGGTLLKGHAFSLDNKLKTSSHLSSLWDGSAITIIRATQAMKCLAGRRVSLHVMAPWNVMEGVLGDADLLGQGFLSRVLPIYPTSRIGFRPFTQMTEDIRQNLDAYNHCIGRLLDQALPTADARTRELRPRVLQLTDTAKDLYQTFYEETERQCRPGAELESVSGLVAKMPEHAVRLAGAMALFEDPMAPAIDDAQLSRGIALGWFYAAEALRTFGRTSEGADMTNARKLLAWMQSRIGQTVFTMRDICRKGPNKLRSKRAATPAIKALIEHNHLRNTGPVTMGNHQCREAYELHPELIGADTNTAKSQTEERW